MKSKITSINVDKRAKKITYVCDGCQHLYALRPGRHWCSCNPGAQFQLMSLHTKADAQRMLSVLWTEGA